MVVVAFVHPDLGIGGAERLIVDAALALKTCNHKVHIFTAHHDPSHCFHETKDGSIPVTCVGDWLPRHLFGHFYALFAYIRMIYVAFYLVMFSKYQADVVFCDQISACIPVLKLSKGKIVFYCHFPDKLLTKRQSFAKKLYRAPLDWLEEKTTGIVFCSSDTRRNTGKGLQTCKLSIVDSLGEQWWSLQTSCFVLSCHQLWGIVFNCSTGRKVVLTNSIHE